VFLLNESEYTVSELVVLGPGVSEDVDEWVGQRSLQCQSDSTHTHLRTVAAALHVHLTQMMLKCVRICRHCRWTNVYTHTHTHSHLCTGTMTWNKTAQSYLATGPVATLVVDSPIAAVHDRSTVLAMWRHARDGWQQWPRDRNVPCAWHCNVGIWILVIFCCKWWAVTLWILCLNTEWAIGTWYSSLKHLSCWWKTLRNLVHYMWIFNVLLHVHVKKWTLKFKMLYMLNHVSNFNKICRICCLNTQIQSLKVSRKYVLPWLKYRIFSMGLFFIGAHRKLTLSAPLQNQDTLQQQSCSK